MRKLPGQPLSPQQVRSLSVAWDMARAWLIGQTGPMELWHEPVSIVRWHGREYELHNVPGNRADALVYRLPGAPAEAAGVLLVWGLEGVVVGLEPGTSTVTGCLFPDLQSGVRFLLTEHENWLIDDATSRLK